MNDRSPELPGMKHELEAFLTPGTQSQSQSPDPLLPDLPTLPDSIFATLPEFLKKVVERCKSNEERDVMLPGALATLSACLPNVHGFYDEALVGPNLFVYITAKASTGKGRLVFCRRLVDPIHREMRRESLAQKALYDAEMREFNLLKGKNFDMEKPIKPKEKMLFIPANNSTTGVFQLLSDNDGRGLIFETEADTLAFAFKTDYGNYSDGFRKFFHHEGFSYFRRTEREFVEIDNPFVSCLLSSSLRQVALLIPNADNGLFSRFVFYQMNTRPVWKNVFPPRSKNTLEVYFDQLGQEFFQLYKDLKEKPAIEFCLSEEQEERFHVFFTRLQEKYQVLQGSDYIATVRRLGLIAFRLAMIFNTLRMMETGDFSPVQECRDEDFEAAIAMVNVLVKHASHVYSELPEQSTPVKAKNKKEQFLELLPETFTRPVYLDVAKSLSIPDRTAEDYILHFREKGLIRNEKYGCYVNLNKNCTD